MKAEQLNGYEFAKRVIGSGGPVDSSHPAVADRFDQFVGADSAAGEFSRGRRRNRRGNRGSNAIQNIRSAVVPVQEPFYFRK